MGLSNIEQLYEVQFRRCSLINQKFTQTEPIYLNLSELPDVFFTTFTCRTVNSQSVGDFCVKGTGPSASAPGNYSVEQKLSLPGSPGAVLRSSGRQHGTGESCRGKSAAKDVYI